MAKYNGEIVAIDIVFPFADCFGGELAKEYPALFTTDSLSRCINCSPLIARDSTRASQVFMNEWVRIIGKARRVITDRGRPTLSGAVRAELSHTFGWQMIHAPQFASHQNGLAERSARSLEISAKRIISATCENCTTQEILTQSVISKNHVPHAVTGLSPELAMTGRCEILPAADTHRSLTTMEKGIRCFW